MSCCLLPELAIQVYDHKYISINKYTLIAGIANICGFYPDLLAVLDNSGLNERKLILYFYHG